MEVEEPSYSSPALIPPFQATSSPPDLVPALSVTPPSHPALPVAAGSDQDSVTFVNSCLEFVYSQAEVREDILAQWKEKLTEFAKRSAEEVSNTEWMVTYILYILL